MKKDLKKTVDTVNTISFVVDVGNSHTVIGIFKDTKVVDYWRLTTRKETTSDEVMNKVGGLLRFSKIKSEEITHVGLSTVVPALERPWIKALDSLLKKRVQVVNSKNCMGLQINYQNPSMAGADRLCNVIAMRGVQECDCRGYGDCDHFRRHEGWCLCGWRDYSRH